MNTTAAVLAMGSALCLGLSIGTACGLALGLKQQPPVTRPEVTIRTIQKGEHDYAT